MNAREAVLAALASGPCGRFTPVQIQKLLFLVDDHVGERTGGKAFHFEPYDYGPFDRAVYDTFEALELEDLAQITPHGGARYSDYALTDAGRERGAQILARLDPEARDHIAQLAHWVHRLGFRELVMAIYKAYPEMAANSVFQT